MIIKVFLALTHSGGLKAVIPLLIASMPVSAVQPTEKACKINNKESGSTAGGITDAKGGGAAWVAA